MIQTISNCKYLLLVVSSAFYFHRCFHICGMLFTSAASLSDIITALINISISDIIDPAIRHVVFIISTAIIIIIFIIHLILFLTANSYLCISCYPDDLYVA